MLFLIASQDVGVRQAIAAILTRRGHTVKEIGDPADILHEIFSGCDAVLSDDDPLSGDGLAALQASRHASFAGPFIVATTANRVAVEQHGGIYALRNDLPSLERAIEQAEQSPP